MSDNEQELREHLDEKQKRRVYQALTASAIVLITVGTVVMRFVEDWTWIDAFYFSVVTATTVGFGDLTPETDGGKLFTVFYIIAGVGLIASFLNTRLQRHALRRARSR